MAIKEDEETERKSLSNPFGDMGYVSALSPCKGGSFGALDDANSLPVYSGITNSFMSSRELNINEVMTIENKMKCPSELIPAPGASDTCELRFFGAVGRTAGIVSKPTFSTAKRRIYVQGAPPGSQEWTDVGGQETSYSSDAPGAVILKAPRVMEQSVTFRLPGADGAAGTGLITDGQGNLSFGSGYWTKLGDDVWYKPGNVYVPNELYLKRKTEGSVLFIGADGQLKEDNPGFFWDDAINSLAIRADHDNASLAIDLYNTANTVRHSISSGPSAGYTKIMAYAADYWSDLQINTSSIQLQSWDIPGAYLSSLTLYGTTGNIDLRSALGAIDLFSESSDVVPIKRARVKLDQGSDDGKVDLYAQSTIGGEGYIQALVETNLGVALSWLTLRAEDATLAGTLIYLTSDKVIIPAMTEGTEYGIYDGSAATLIRSFQPTGSDGYNLFVGDAGNSTMSPGGGSSSLASYNVGVGASALHSLTTGKQNFGLGLEALYHVTTGQANTAVGTASSINLVDGSNNVAVGVQSLYENVSGNLNVVLGYSAGFYETGSSKLFIDNATRASEADGRLKALIYGIFAAATADQYLYINGNLSVPHPITSTLAIGTAPLAVTSTTVNPNLNADLLDGLHGASYLTSVTAHDVLSATHGDSTAAAVSRGAMIAGIGATPKWTAIAAGTLGQVWTMGADEPAWAAASSAAGDSMTKAVAQALHGFAVGDVVKCTGANTYSKAQADSEANAEVVGIVSVVTDGGNFTLLMGGYWAHANVPAVAAGTVVFLSPTSAGAMTVTEPTTDGQISKPLGVIVENAAKMLIFNWRGVELATLAVTGADLGTTFGATATNLHNTIITTFTNRAYAFQNLATCASAAAMFTGLINTGGTGGLTATNVPYDGDSNEAMLVPFPTLTLDARIVLHNTTRGTARLVTAIDTTNNFITTVSTADAWADNDALTMESQTCSGGGSRFCDLDLSGMIPATATAVYLEVNVLDSAGGGGLFRLHPYGAYSASKIQHTYGQVANISNMGHCWVPVTSQRVCIDWGASAAGTTLTLQLRCCGWIENADT